VSNERRAWKVRMGSSCEDILAYLEKGEVLLDYGVDSLAPRMSKGAIESLLRKQYHESSEKRISAHTGQIYRILNEIVSDNLIVVPIDRSTQFCIGAIQNNHPKVIGTDLIFSVKWLRNSIPLNEFQQDLRYSFMAIMKVCEIKRNNAVSRLYDISKGKPDPGC
jgi:restriction system protein